MTKLVVILSVFLGLAALTLVVFMGLYIQSRVAHDKSNWELQQLHRYVEHHATEHRMIRPKNNEHSEHLLPARTYWHGKFARKQHGSVMSFLAKHPKLSLWLLLDTDTLHLNTNENPWIKSLGRTSRVKIIPYQTDRRRNDDNLPAKADVVRYTDLFRYGGIWFDLDVIWLKNVQPLIDGRTPWAYPWGRDPKAGLNNGIMYCPQAHPAMLSVLKIVDSCHHTNLPVARHVIKQPSFFAQPIEYFDPSWEAPSGVFAFSDFFRPARVTPLPDTFFPHCYAYHWHNQWKASVDPDSWFARLERQNYAKLRWAPVKSTP